MDCRNLKYNITDNASSMMTIAVSILLAEAWKRFCKGNGFLMFIGSGVGLKTDVVVCWRVTHRPVCFASISGLVKKNVLTYPTLPKLWFVCYSEQNILKSTNRYPKFCYKENWKFLTEWGDLAVILSAFKHACSAKIPELCTVVTQSLVY
jgi:hypothetical protein